jgi:hypothetical protein
MNLLGSWLNTTELLRQTVLKWCNRDSVQDRSYHPPSSNHLNSAQEVVAVALRQTSLVSLDELLALVREFLNLKVSHSGLDRCLRMHCVGSPRDPKAKDERTEHRGFKAYDSQYLHIDVKYLAKTAIDTLLGYLFVAIHTSTRWIFISI